MDTIEQLKAILDDRDIIITHEEIEFAPPLERLLMEPKLACWIVPIRKGAGGIEMAVAEAFYRLKPDFGYAGEGITVHHVD